VLSLLIYDIVCQQVLALVISASGQEWLLDSPWIYVITEVLIFGLPFAAYHVITREKIAGTLPLGRLGLKNAALIVLMCLLISPALMLISGLTSVLFNLGNAAEAIMSPLSGAPMILSLLAVGLMPAIFEEITFRGVILTNHKGLGVKAAVLINGLCFGIIHLNLQQFPYAFAVGVVFALFVLRSGSIWASVLAHFCLNASQLALNAYPVVLSRLIGGATATPEGFAMLTVVAVAAGAGFGLIYRVFARGKTRRA